MKKIKAWLNKIKQNRKLRCGGYSVLLTVLVTAVCLIIIALADVMEEKYALTADLSFNAATTQGEVTRNVLKGLEKDVHIYALIAEDGQNDTLLQLLKRYDAASEHVTVSHERILENPALLNKFAQDIGNQKIARDCLIVWCAENNRARVLDEDDYYYIYANEILYEKRITEAVLYVSGDELPVVQILASHGGLTAEDLVRMEEWLISSNYDVQWIDLESGDVPNPEHPLMILQPTNDFSQAELGLLTAYAQDGGDFLIAAGWDAPLDMPNYNALLRSYGVEAYPGLVVTMQEEMDAYYDDKPYSLMPYLVDNSATGHLVESGSSWRLIMPGSRAFRVLDMEGSSAKVYPVLETGKSYIRNFTDGLETMQQQPTDETGYFNVAVWTNKMYDNGAVSHALIIGNSYIFYRDDLLDNNRTDSRVFLLQMIRSMQGKEPIDLSILPKEGVREDLRLNKIAPAVLVTILLPLLVICGALLVLLPRKSR